MVGMKRIKVGVLASGRGTDFQSLVDASESGTLGPAEVVLLVCNNPGALVLERAKNHRIPAVVIDHRGRSRRAFEEEVVAALRDKGVELVVHAGFMRIVTPYYVDQFRNRIINIHPSLLPAFPGAHAQRDALDYGVKVSGCTVHFVDESVDGGPIILQRAVPVQASDTEESLAERILEEEHRLLPLAVRLFAEDWLKVEGRKVAIDALGMELLMGF